MKSEVISLGQYVVFYFNKKDGLKYRVVECKDGYIDLLSYDPKGDPESIRIQPLPMEHPEGWPHSHEEIISKFKDGKERYNKIALFRRVIEMLVRDGDPYEALDQIIDLNERLRLSLQEYIKNGPVPIYVTPTPEHLKRPVLVKDAYPKKNWWVNKFNEIFR